MKAILDSSINLPPSQLSCHRLDFVQEVEDIRGISEEFAADGNTASTFGLSNMVWGFGQFLGAHH